VTPGRKRSILLFASVLALALGALGGVAGANHSLFQHLSAGQINGNGAFPADFQGASDDGTRVFFETSEPLVPADTDIHQDVYERAVGTTTKTSPGNGAFNAGFAGASADGSAVFFETQEKVFASDNDDVFDVYGAYLAP
jgi:hypothetical protein